jgi:hypothetical protein
MKRYCLLALFTAYIFFSCKNHSSATDTPAAGDSNAVRSGDSTTATTDTSAAARAFFPVSDFIGGQVHMIDSLQMPLTKTVVVDQLSKLSPATDAEFKKLAAAFRQPDISDPALKPFYKETSISDQSIASVVLSYTTANPALEVQKIDVIIGANSDKVKTIYIEKQRLSADTIVRQKLYWKVKNRLRITTEKSIGNTHLPLEQVIITWDPSE